MKQLHTLSAAPRIVALKTQLAGAGSHAQERIYIEDGWVFREHHGKYVECICRSDEIVKPADGPQSLRTGRG